MILYFATSLGLLLAFLILALQWRSEIKKEKRAVVEIHFYRREGTKLKFIQILRIRGDVPISRAAKYIELGPHKVDWILIT